MHTLRFKLSLALIFTSLSAVIVVGITAQSRVTVKFDQIAMERAFENFQEDVSAYIATYGSWNNAQKAERFGQFSRRRRALTGDFRIESFHPEADEFMQHDEAHLPPPPPGLDEAGRPPFRFILLDPQGKVLMGAGQYKNGELVPPAVRLKSIPIFLQEQAVALAIPLGKPNLSERDLNYLATIKQALIDAFFIACALAIVLAFLLSNRLSSSLHELTLAINEMGQGQLRQNVTIHSKDETGVLSKAFNQMSNDLADAYEGLEESNRIIKEQASLLKELSIRDELTQLYNRRYFNEQANILVSQMKRYRHSLSFMLGDIDHFKKVNDNFSHAIGDAVLKAVAEILQANTRESDVVARYGGEEFVIIFNETPLEQAIKQCEKLRKLIEIHPWSTIHPELHITMSMGLNGDTKLDNVEKILAVADEKLYQAKANGRNQICY